MRRVMLLILLLFLTSFLSAQSKNSLSGEWKQLLPDSIDGWQRIAADEIYQANNLYEFLDGGAEVYLQYGFRRLIHRIYRRNNGPDILLDFFDMGNCDNAYGLFLQQSVDSDSTFGQGSYYAQGYLLFWKNRYLITILALQETPQSKRAVFDLARQIDNRIQPPCPLPALPSKLPLKKQIKHSLRFFHTYFWLRRAFNLPEKNIFRITDSVKVALARYSDGTTLALIAYPEAKQALKVMKVLLRSYFKTSSRTPVVQKGNDHYLLEVKGHILIFARNSRGSAPLKNLLTILKNSQ